MSATLAGNSLSFLYPAGERRERMGVERQLKTGGEVVVVTAGDRLIDNDRTASSEQIASERSTTE